MTTSAVPGRPPAWEERCANRLFLFLSPHLPRTAPADPPARLAPWQNLLVPRLGADGTLTATWFEAPAPARGAVLLLHPWVKWGKTYFHRRGRIEALRAAGYHALALDLGGFGGSSPAAGFFDRDVAAGLAFLRRQAGPSLPLHVWGVSSGGYWAHLALSRSGDVTGAFFEETSPHLLEWSWRMVPSGRTGYAFFRRAFLRAYGFLDIRRHAAALGLAAVSYVSGSEDRGVLPAETLELARLAGGRHLVVEGAGHLGCFGEARDALLAMALGTFSRAEETQSLRASLAGAAAAGDAAASSTVSSEDLVGSSLNT
jgi:pimeloyl-ACP methyl ester carboxylesterase